MTSNKLQITSIQASSSSTYEDDESDSSLFLAAATARRSRALLATTSTSASKMVKFEPDETDENRPLCSMIASPQPPTVFMRRPPPSLVPAGIRVTAAAAKQSPPRLPSQRITRIVDSLLLKQQQQHQAKSLPPAPPPQPQQSAKPAQYHSIMMVNLAKRTNSSGGDGDNGHENNEDENSLGSLDWLSGFDLGASTGFKPLSPPQSPPWPSNDDECDSSMMCRDTKRIQLDPNVINATTTMAKKPAITFSCLAFLAIETAPRKRLSIKEIFTWVIEHFPYYGNVPSGSWKNSIRHNLASNACFSKVDKNLLTMRDFSGKGSLWCTSPSHRPQLVATMTKLLAAGMTGAHMYVELAKLDCLQDVKEQPLQAQSSSRAAGVTSTGSDYRSRSASNLTHHHHSRVSSFPKPTLNPRLLVGGAKLFVNTSLSGDRSQQVMASISKLSKSSMNLSINQVQISQAAVAYQTQNENYSELDAVKALLSMKSRASSVPSTASLIAPRWSSGVEDKQAATQQQQEPKTTKGRRKQLLMRPTKKPAVVQDVDNSSEDFGSPKSVEINLLDNDDNEDEEKFIDGRDEDGCPKNSKSSLKRSSSKHVNETAGSKQKMPKLLVKFTSFHKPTNKRPAPKADDNEVELGEIVKRPADDE